MKMEKENTLDRIVRAVERGQKMVAMLIDPDKYNAATLQNLQRSGNLPDIVLVGGSIVQTDTDAVVGDIKRTVGKESMVILFPGDEGQLSAQADALLFLSLVSGRNPEYLIGQQVRAAVKVRQMGLETIATAYMLIDGGRRTSVEYVSNTMPLPADKPDLAVATAMASELMGMQMAYLEAGSGALNPVPTRTIEMVRKAVRMPLIVGGGLRTRASVEAAFEAGADIAVVGTAIEQNPEVAAEIMAARNR